MTDQDDSRRPPIPDVTVEILRSIAEAQGLQLTDDDLAAILPAVRMGRGVSAIALDMPGDGEPAVEFRSGS